MINLLSTLLLGFFLGMRHATDPDHVIAVTTFVSRQRSLVRAALTGISWGIGHTLTILVVGTAIILFKLVIPPRLGLGMELSVGLMLIVLGLMSVKSFLNPAPEQRQQALHNRDVISGDVPSLADSRHLHLHEPGLKFHVHGPERGLGLSLDRAFGSIGLYQLLRPLIVGVIHGLAGSAAVALLVLTAIQDPSWAVGYLLVFGFGTILGMMLITMTVAVSLSSLTRNHDPIARKLAVASGALSLAFGLFLIAQICITGGLFTHHPQWTPR